MQQRWAGTRNAAATYALHIALGGHGERASTRAPHGSHSWRSESRPCDWRPGTRRWAYTSQNTTHRSRPKSLAFRRWGLHTCKRPRACQCKTKRDEMGRPHGETARQRDSEPARLVLRAPMRYHGIPYSASMIAPPAPLPAILLGCFVRRGQIDSTTAQPASAAC
jgi:hypothetical protein